MCVQWNLISTCVRVSVSVLCENTLSELYSMNCDKYFFATSKSDGNSGSIITMYARKKRIICVCININISRNTSFATCHTQKRNGKPIHRTKHTKITWNGNITWRWICIYLCTSITRVRARLSLSLRYESRNICFNTAICVYMIYSIGTHPSTSP